jgi:hypothetical protein
MASLTNLTELKNERDKQPVGYSALSFF